MNIKHIIFMSLLIAMIPLSSAWSSVVVIVNPNLALDTISKKQAKKIFLGKVKKFSNGTKIDFRVQRDSNASKIFQKKILKKKDNQLKRYWAKRIFSGKGVAPKIVDDDRQAKSFVAKNKGGISYIDDSGVDNSVKVIYQIK